MSAYYCIYMWCVLLYAVCVLTLLHMMYIYVSSYYCIYMWCILLHVYVSAYYCIYMWCVLLYAVYMCPHTTAYDVYICVLILLHIYVVHTTAYMCPHTTAYICGAYCCMLYMCVAYVLILLYILVVHESFDYICRRLCVGGGLR